MKEAAKRHRLTGRSEEMWGMRGGRSWCLGKNTWVRGEFSLSILISSLFVPYNDRGIVPAFVFLEAVEIIVLFPFILNETQVEPVLFIELLNISEDHI